MVWSGSQEFGERLSRVRTSMRERDFDALLITDPANLFYLTGYNAWSFYVPQVLYVPAEGPLALVLREMDAVGAHRTASGIDADCVHGYPEDLIHQPDTHPGQWIAARLRDLAGSEPRRVGYEGEAHFLTPRTFLALRDGLPEWELADCQDLVNWVRLVKSEAEVDLLRAAGRVCTAATLAGLAAVRSGRPQNEVAAEILATQARGTAGVDGDYPAIVPMLPVGQGADTPHLTWSDEPLPDGEPISFELAGVHHRYHAPIARTGVIGSPSPELDRLAKVTVEGLEAALAEARAGVTAAAVAGAFTQVIEAAGYTKHSRLGYSIGIGYPPDWGERTVSIRRDDETVLATNMTFHLIAGMWITGTGFEVSESLRVSDAGVELFTDVPRELIRLGEDR